MTCMFNPYEEWNMLFCFALISFPIVVVEMYFVMFCETFKAEVFPTIEEDEEYEMEWCRRMLKKLSKEAATVAIRRGIINLSN